jgi:hypothetical protein
MVLMQFISVNLLLFAARREAPFGLARNLAHQLLCPPVFLGAALLVSKATSYWDGAGDIPRFLASGAGYTLLSLLLLLACPAVCGLRRADLRALLNRLPFKA